MASDTSTEGKLSGVLENFCVSPKYLIIMSEIVDLPCFLFRADVFIHSKSPGRLLPVLLSCVYLAL